MRADQEALTELSDAGLQLAVSFSGEGSILATGGEVSGYNLLSIRDYYFLYALLFSFLYSIPRVASYPIGTLAYILWKMPCLLPSFRLLNFFPFHFLLAIAYAHKNFLSDSDCHKRYSVFGKEDVINYSHLLQSFMQKQFGKQIMIRFT